MKKLLLTMTVLLATMGTWAQETADYAGIYTLGVDVNKQRGYVCAGEGWSDYPVLTEITLSGYTDRNVTSVENGKNWYIKASADNTGYYLYNVAVGKFLVNSDNQKVDFGDTPQIWGIADNGAYKKIVKPGTTNQYLSGGCSRYAAGRPMAYDTNAGDGGAKFTIEAVADGTTTFAAEIAVANALIDKIENAHISETLTGANAWWTSATLYPAGLESLANYTTFKKETMVAVPVTRDVTVTFTYTGGSHGLKILGVDLVNSNGVVIAKDYTTKQAGGDRVGQVYTLSSIPAGTYLLRWYVGNNDRNNKLNLFNGTAETVYANAAEDGQIATFFSSIKTVAGNKYSSCESNNIDKVGYYTNTSMERLAETKDVADATVANIGSLAEAIEHLQVVLPAPGKFYRIKNNAGNAYLTCGTSGVAQTAADDQGNMKEDVFYLTDDNQLISYANGLYFNGNSNLLNYKGDVGAGVANFAFYASPEVGKLYVEFTAAGGNHRFLYSAGAGATNAGGDNSADQSVLATYPSYRFTVEEVEWLPVSMNAEVGYASLYSPVALNCEGRVEAYIATTVSDDNTSIQLEECTAGIPANTGVILKYVEGAEINTTTGCVYLSVNGGGVTAPSGNALMGGLAAANISDDAYVLANGTNGIGLYKAMKNQTGDTWKNNGFKAYLPASALNPVGDEAPSLAFSFGTETAIGNIESTGNAAGKSAIYDLSGRRVKSAQKGIFIINGKKVVK